MPLVRPAAEVFGTRWYDGTWNRGQPVQAPTEIPAVRQPAVSPQAELVGIFPNEAAIVRLVGAVLLGINDEWATQHRYMQLEPMGELLPTIEGEAAPPDHTLIPPRAA